MLRVLAGLVAACPFWLNAAGPVTSRGDEVGRLLNEWAAAGTAAGLAAITYENRDDGHSMPNLNDWPGLKVHAFSEQERSTGMFKGPARVLRDSPTLGNCSMAAPADRGGSLGRLYLMEPGGSVFLARQYLSNQLFIYPEHQDHDPGGNGVGGWGDLYPGNTPALLISQGSSGSDLPFLRALLSAGAAMPPDVQELLIRKHLLAPTLQQLLRRYSRLVENEADYLNGKAHPVVFQSSHIDEKRMVLAANRMTRGSIPPLALIEVLEETAFEPGIHFFEPEEPHPWQLAASPVHVARVFRGNQPEYECVISTKNSGDLLGRPMRIEVAVLQGDPALVRIQPEDGGLKVRLRIRWQPPEATTRADSEVRSHRVDVGFFANNGVTLSAPSIFSLYMLPNERRFFDAKGRVSEIHYQASNPDLGLPGDETDARWMDVIGACTLPSAKLPGNLMQRAFEAAERAWLEVAHSRLILLQSELQRLEQDPNAKLETAEQRRHFLDALRSTLNTPLPGTRKLTARKTMETALQSIARFEDLYPTLQTEIQILAAFSKKSGAADSLNAEVQKLIDWGILIRQESGQVHPLHDKEDRPVAHSEALKALNLTVLSHALYPQALQRDAGPAWVDPRLSTRKAWRDVYHYDEASGALRGWTRHYSGKTARFDARGRWLQEDGAEPLPVQYYPDPATGLRFEAAK